MNPAQPASDRFPMGEREFLVLMALLQALLALAIDVMLPAIGVISNELGVSDPNDRQLIVGVYLVCGGLGTLFPGSLGDRFGRKPVVMTCLSAYFVLSLGCALASDFTMLLVFRGLMGFFTAGLLVMPMAIIRDRFSGDRMASAQSLVAMVFMVVPMLAPSLGQAVMWVVGWRGIFGVTTAISALLLIWTWQRLPETLKPENVQTVRPMAILGNMRATLTCRDAIGYFLGTALIQSAVFGYINSSQQLVAEHFGAGDAFPIVFGGMALGIAVANFANSRIVERFGARRVSHTGLFAFITLCAVHLMVASTGEETLFHFVVLMTPTMCLLAFMGANFQAIALQPFARTAGAAASVQAFIRMVGGSLLGIAIGQAYDGTSRPLLVSMLAAGLGALLVILYSERGRLFRRLHYPDDE